MSHKSPKMSESEKRNGTKIISHTSTLNVKQPKMYGHCG